MKKIRWLIFAVGIIVSTAITAQNQNSIIASECWFDNDISTKQAVTSGQNINISGLLQGLHSLTLRVEDANELWSSPLTKFFLVPIASEMTETTIALCQYWFDDAFDNLETNPAAIHTSTVGSNNIVLVDVGDLPAGNHTLWWRLGDSKGAWSVPLSETFVIELITTGIEHLDNGSTHDQESAVWFSIDGRKGNGALRKGVYISNGKKMIVR